MNAARLVINVEHAAADHHGYEHRQRNRARQQILHILDVGIHLHNLQHRLLQDPRLYGWIIQRRSDVRQLALERRSHEVVAVVYD